MLVQQFLKNFVDVMKERLSTNFVGVYLHGSLAMNCYRHGVSDVDILVVVKKKLSKVKKQELIYEFLRLEEEHEPVKLEISVLLEKDVIKFVYPTPFELHYSDDLIEEYLQNPDYICGDDVDPDLAAHMVVTLERGVCLDGKPIKDVFQPIDRSYYVSSIRYDIEEAEQEIVHNPVYYTLNLCRVLLYLKDGVVSSKKEAGQWGIKHLPAEYRDIVSDCLSQYIGENENYINEDKLIGFAQFMLAEIEKLSR